jgi:hypothetical protein
LRRNPYESQAKSFEQDYRERLVYEEKRNAIVTSAVGQPEVVTAASGAALLSDVGAESE